MSAESDLALCGACLTPTPVMQLWCRPNGGGEICEDCFAEDYPAEYAAEKPDMVNRPAHYTVGGIETIDFIEAKKLGYHLANAVKYISRAEHKGKFEEDVSKAIWYLQRVLEYRKSI